MMQRVNETRLISTSPPGAWTDFVFFSSAEFYRTEQRSHCDFPEQRARRRQQTQKKEKCLNINRPINQSINTVSPRAAAEWRINRTTARERTGTEKSGADWISNIVKRKSTGRRHGAAPTVWWIRSLRERAEKKQHSNSVKMCQELLRQ